MTPERLKFVQAQVLTLCGLLQGLELAEASELMEAAQSAAKIADPVVWAKAKDAHIRMRALMDATLTYQNTVDHIRAAVVDAHKRTGKRASPIILLS